MSFMWILALLPLALASPVPSSSYELLANNLPVNLDDLIKCGDTTEPWPEAVDLARKSFNKFLAKDAARDQKLAEYIVKEAAEVEAEVARRSVPVAKTLNSTLWGQIYRRLELQFNLLTCAQVSTQYREMALQSVGYAFQLASQPTNKFTLSPEVPKLFKDLFTEVANSAVRLQTILSQDRATEAEVREVRQTAARLVKQAKQIATPSLVFISQHLLEMVQNNQTLGIEDRMLTGFYAQVFHWVVPFLEQFQYDVEHKIH